jgi:hypothetical protein
MALPDPQITPTLGAEEMAALYGCSSWAIYQHKDELPVKPIRVGRSLRWPTAPVLRSLGLETEAEVNPVTDPSKVRVHLLDGRAG